MEQDKNSIRFEIKKRKPKKNPKVYEISSFQDMVDAVDSKNINKFVRELKIVLNLAILTKLVAKQQYEKNNQTIPEGESIIKLPAYTWIDD